MIRCEWGTVESLPKLNRAHLLYGEIAGFALPEPPPQSHQGNRTQKPDGLDPLKYHPETTSSGPLPAVSDSMILVGESTAGTAT